MGQRKEVLGVFFVLGSFFYSGLKVGRGSPSPPLNVERIGCRTRYGFPSTNGRLGEPSLTKAD
jgi:hypothetical protein